MNKTVSLPCVKFSRKKEKKQHQEPVFFFQIQKTNALVTCLHVVSDEGGLLQPEKVTISHIPTNRYSMKVKKIEKYEEDKTLDFALLILEEVLEDVKPAELVSIKNYDNQKWFNYFYPTLTLQFVGFGAGEIMNQENIDNLDIIYSLNKVKEDYLPRVCSTTGQKEFTLTRYSGTYEDASLSIICSSKDVTGYEGDSGSPVFIDGKVVGIMTGGYKSNFNNIFRKLLDENNTKMEAEVQQLYNSLKSQEAWIEYYDPQNAWPHKILGYNLIPVKFNEVLNFIEKPFKAWRNNVLNKSYEESLNIGLIDIFVKNRKELWTTVRQAQNEQNFTTLISAFGEKLIKWINLKVEENQEK